MNLFDIGMDTYADERKESDLQLNELLSAITSAPVQQLAKGLFGKFTDTAQSDAMLQTNEDFDAPVIDALRTTVVKALERGERGTRYEDYDKLPDGTDMGKFVRSDEARKDVTNFVKMLGQSPALQAATSIGRGSIQVNEDGEVYLTDKYNFSKSSSNKGDDLYSWVRKGIGKVMTEDSADTSGHNIVLHMGHIDQLLGRKINKGDSLQKIARETGVSVDDLVSYNNITNPNKIKAGQYIKIPPVEMRQPEEIVSTQELIAGDDTLFRGDIGA